MGAIVIKNKGQESSAQKTQVEEVVVPVKLDEPVSVTASKNKREKKVEAQVTKEKSRKETIREYQLSDGTIKEEVYFEPVNYFDANAQEYKAIDNTLEAQENDKELGDYYQNRANSFNVKFPKKLNASKHMVIEKDGCRVSLQLLGVETRSKNNAEAKLLDVENAKDAGGKEIAINKALIYEEILPAVDLKFLVKGNSVKDYLIIKEKREQYEYSYKLTAENVTVTLDERREEIIFVSKETGKKIFVMPAPYMVDADDNTSEEAYYEIDTISEEEYIIHVKLNEMWINRESTTMPIAVDPEIVVYGDESKLSRYGWYNKTMDVKNGGYNYLGYYPGSTGTTSTDAMPYERQYYKMDLTQLQRLPVKKIELLVSFSEVVPEYLIAVGKTNETLEHTSSYQCIPNDEPATDYVALEAGKLEYKLDITSIVKSALIESTKTSVCFYLKGLIENTSNPDLPLSNVKIVAEYIRGCSAKSIGTELQQDVYRAGVGSVNLNTGMLKFEHEDFSWNGNLMPVNIRHIYSSWRSSQEFTLASQNLITNRFVAMRLGFGWKLNLQQTIVKVIESAGFDEKYKYVYCDEEGIEHFFISGEKTYLFVDENGEGMEYNSNRRVLSYNGLEYQFDQNGYLIAVTNAYGVSQEIVYNEKRQIVKVIDGAKREFNLEYNESTAELVKIISPSGSVIEYEYTTVSNVLHWLKAIKYEDGSCTKFSYDYLDNLEKVANCYYENDAWVEGYHVSYVHSIPFGITKEINQNGVVTQIDYASKNLTVVTDCLDETTRKTAYQFNEEGELETSYELKDDNEILVSNNLLENQAFESGSECWDICGENWSISSYTSEYGKAIGILGCGCNGESCATQELYVSKGTYTLSAYVRRNRGYYDAMCQTKAYIKLSNKHTGKTVTSQTVVNTYGGFKRISCTIEVTAATTLKVWLVNSGKEYAFFSGIQLEKGGHAGEYNYLADGSFERGTTCWQGKGFSVVSAESQDGVRGAKLFREGEDDKYFKQIVSVDESKGTRETFELSGWAKSNCSLKASEGESNFKLMARIVYETTESDTTEVYEDYEANFACNFSEWQYASVTFSKQEYRKIKHIEIYGIYNLMTGEAYFDGLQLIRKNREVGLTIADFITEESEEAADSSYPSESVEETEEKDPSIDKNGNAVFSITNQEGKKGTLYQTFGYSENGNDKLYETDHRNNRTEYTYYADTSLVKTMKQPCRSKVSYTYDAMNQLTCMSTSIDGQTVQVSYTYDYLGNVKTISQNGFTYEIEYDECTGQIKSIGVEGLNTLVAYTYTAGGNLKTATYGNGHVAEYSYDRYGRVLGENWSSGNIAQAQYSYTYDDDGNVIKTLDKTNKLLYTYSYHKGQLMQSEEYTYTDTEGAVRELQFRTEYQYKDGLIARKADVYVKGDEEDRKEYEYHYFDEDDKFTLVLPTGVKAVTETDHFGRKVFEELQLGSGFVSREYTYTAGAYDKARMAGHLKSNPETDLVEKIVYDNGKELRYTYDESGNITTVRDENGLLEAYTYDLLGRLKTEQNVLGAFYKVYTYDVGGNIVSKKTYVCASATVVTNENALVLQTTDFYGYDSVWKDKLVSYNGETISYDANGNPTSYRGKTATWEKGRQLKSLGENTYKYNANGVRIAKTVDGVVHKYFVQGIKILREEFGSHVLDFLYGVEGDVVGFTDNGTAYYYYKNLQGDVIGITDKDGVLIATYAYDAWGKPISIEGDLTIANLNPIRYRGYYYDSETGLYYLNSRYYAPEICRFINADEVSTLFALQNEFCGNLFVYCKDNPINYDDEGGLFSFKDIKNFILDIIKDLKNKVESYFASLIVKKNGWIEISTDIPAAILDFLIGILVRKWLYNIFRKGLQLFVKTWLKPQPSRAVEIMIKIANFLLNNQWGKAILKVIAKNIANAFGVKNDLVGTIFDRMVNDAVSSISKTAGKEMTIVSAFSSIGSLLALIYFDLPDGNIDGKMRIRWS